MKVLQIVHSFLPYTIAGTEVYAYRLSRALSLRNEISVFFRVNNPKEKEYALACSTLDGVSVFTINRTFRDCHSFQELYSNEVVDNIFGALLDEIKPDIIHIHHLLFLSLGMVNEAKKRNIPVVYTLHDYWLFCHRGQLLRDDLSLCSAPSVIDCQNCLALQLSIRRNTVSIYNAFRRRLPGWLVGSAKGAYLGLAKVLFLNPDKTANDIRARLDYVSSVVNGVSLFIAPSHFIKEKFIGFGISEERIYASRCGIDHNGLNSIQKTQSEKIRFGYIGTLLPTKGVNILITAFKGIKNSNISLSIYGKPMVCAGYESYYRKLVKMTRGDKRVRLMGGFNNKDIGKILAAIDILIVPSIWAENSPLVIQEAFLAKTPIIASRIGGIPELVNDGVNGLLFNPGDANDLREKIKHVIDNPEIINKFKDNIPKIKSIEENAREIEKIYSKLTAISKV